MSLQFADIKAIFLAAIEKASPQERAAYLDQSCGGDSELRRRVETLIKASEESGAFLDEPVVPAADLPGTVAFKPIAEQSGTVIGPYKLVTL